MTFFSRKRPSPTLPTINFYSAFDSFRPSSSSSFKSAAVNHRRLRRSKAQGLPPLERRRAARGTEPNQIRRIGPRSSSSLSSHKTQPDLEGEGAEKKKTAALVTHSLSWRIQKTFTQEVSIHVRTPSFILRCASETKLTVGY